MSICKRDTQIQEDEICSNLLTVMRETQSDIVFPAPHPNCKNGLGWGIFYKCLSPAVLCKEPRYVTHWLNFDKCFG